eukprot:4358547-Ditylum_brightwellii.AAC.2
MSGADTGAGNEGCKWVITLESVTGDPDLMQIMAFHGILSTGLSTSVTVGARPSIVCDTVEITHPVKFQGNTNLIQSELSNIKTVGMITVTADSDNPDTA